MRFRSFSNRGSVQFVYKQTQELNLSTDYFISFSENTTCTSLRLTTRRPKPVSLKVLTNIENQDVEVFQTQRNPNLRRRSIPYGRILLPHVHRSTGIPPAEVTWPYQATVSKRLYGRKGPTKW
jgi:hypothetical protein